MRDSFLIFTVMHLQENSKDIWNMKSLRGKSVKYYTVYSHGVCMCKGDSLAIWNINSVRGKSVKHYTLATGFACAKGFLLDRKLESAAAISKLFDKHLPEQKKPFIKGELQKLIAEWPSEVIKRQKKDDRLVLGKALVEDNP
ncbi:hypothetical protein EJB05_51111, partial [Eragrostis curvula]